MIQNVVVLGAGSAGLIGALTLKTKLPALRVRVIRSAEIGVIGVGEGTTAAFPRHFFEYLKLSPADFYARTEPTWKLGLKFLWGQRPEFYYTFMREYAARHSGLARNHGFYVADETRWVGPVSAFMAHDKAFPRKPDGTPLIHNNHAFHLENKKLVAALDHWCRQVGVEIAEPDRAEQRFRRSGIHLKRRHEYLGDAHQYWGAFGCQRLVQFQSRARGGNPRARHRRPVRCCSRCRRRARMVAKDETEAVLGEARPRVASVASRRFSRALSRLTIALARVDARWAAALSWHAIALATVAAA